MGGKDIKLKHKVQLRKKTEGGSEGNSPKSKNWIWWIVTIAILCVIGFLVLSKSDKNVEQKPVAGIVEKVTTEPVEAILSDSETEDMAVKNGTKEEAAVSSDETSADSDSNEQGQLTASSEGANVATTISSTNPNISNDVEAEAMKVIRGDYGIGQERKDRLGAKYQTIQNRVNELKREGVF